MTKQETPPRPEHPNPAFVRAAWQTLHGHWQFAFDSANEGEQRRWWSGGSRAGQGGPSVEPFGQQIVVPFPWESPRSGIGDPAYQGVAWYRRVITIPAPWLERGLQPVLHFGAVDWEARVWVNGRLAAEHSGGFTPFAVDLDPFVAAGSPLTVTVRVRDDCDAATLLAKQVQSWYTHTSGIWQPVWLEGRPADHITAVALRPSLAGARLAAEVTLAIVNAGEYVLQLRSADDRFAPQEQRLTLAAGRHQVRLEAPIPQPRAWSPDDPHLYPLEVELRAAGSAPDLVKTYTGLRDIATGAWDGRDYDYVLLNGLPVYLRGALDQAFHPDGLYTYPSDDAIRADLQAAKDLGLNMLRCHIKINDPRYYYWADRLGLLIMQDIPNPAISTPTSQRFWEQCFQATLARDGNHPSIIAWILFNETWGLTEHRLPQSWQWLADWVARAKALDPTRLVEDNSPCNYDHVTTDLNTWHFYIGDWKTARRHVQEVVDKTYPGSTFNFVSGLSSLPEARRYVQGRQPLLNSEYAGLGAGGGDKDISQSLKFLTTDLRRHDKICGYVYTELTDVEWEHNGLLEYDRAPKAFGYAAFVDGMTTADLLGADVVGLDYPPCRTLAPGAMFSAAAFVSHWSACDLQGSALQWRLEFIDNRGGRFVVSDGQLPLDPRRYAVTAAGVIAVTLPDHPGLATIALRLVAADGRTVARNYVNVEVWAQPSPRQERLPGGWALRVEPGEYAAGTWPTPRLLADGGKLSAGGSGSFSYALPWPEGLAADAVRGLRLTLELGTRGAGERNTPWGGRVPGFPQTEPRHTTPGDVVINLNGTIVDQRQLRDDPNDARGILSFQRNAGDDSSYGELVEVVVAQAAVRGIAEAAQQAGSIQLRLEVPADAALVRGLSVYGERMGAYPLAPTLFIDLSGQ